MKNAMGTWPLACMLALMTLLSACQAQPGPPETIAGKKAAATAEAPIPKLVSKDGRHALLVDGAPFLILGAQVNNSSNYPAVLDEVWPAIEVLKPNTVMVPIAWEQVEAEEGKFDFAFVDTLLAQAREHKVRLVLLWFATWKNSSASAPNTSLQVPGDLPSFCSNASGTGPSNTSCASGEKSRTPP